MELIFKKSFVKKAKTLSDKYQKELRRIIDEFQDAEHLNNVNLDIKNLKNNYYRIRMGKYRIGIEVDGNCIFWTILSRGDIYKNFPPK